MGAILNEMEDVLMHYGMPKLDGIPGGQGKIPISIAATFSAVCMSLESKTLLTQMRMVSCGLVIPLSRSLWALPAVSSELR